MISIIKDYLKRVSVHSESLSRTEKYINKPWVHIDNNGDYQKYIFDPSGDLFMSFNGKGEVGKWKYLSEANLIFIDRLTDKIFLKQSFFDESVMILKIDGTNEDLFILANENIIPDLDVSKYLSSFITKIEMLESSSFFKMPLLEGNILKIDRGKLNYSKVGMSVLLNDKVVPDGEYFADSGFFDRLIGYQIVESKIKDLFWLIIFTTSYGTFKIYQNNQNAFSIGDRVLLNDKIAPNGKYKIQFMDYITVINGVISNTSIF